MTTTSPIRTAEDHSTNRILHGDCIEAMRRMPAQSVDFMSGSSSALLRCRPLRTVCASFPAYGSSLSEAPRGSRFRHQEALEARDAMTVRV